MSNQDLKQGQTRRGSNLKEKIDFDEFEGLVLSEKLADPNYQLTSQEEFNAVNFISEEYNSINKNNISAKQPQVGTVPTDMAVLNQVARASGVVNPRINSSFLGKLEASKPGQLYGEEQYDLDTFKGLVDRGFITTKDGTPINIEPLADPNLYRSAGSREVPAEYDPYYPTYQEYLNNPQNFKTENLPQKLELLKNKELAAYKLGERFEIETPYMAGLGFGPKVKPNMINWGERNFFDSNNSIDYYMFTKDDAAPEITFVKDQQGNDIPQFNLTSTQQDFFNRMLYVDPDLYNSYVDSLKTPFNAKQILEDGFVNLGGDMAFKTAEELGIEGAPEGAVFVPVTTKLGPGEEAFVSNLQNIVADVNTSYGLSQALGALSFELIPGIGLFSGTFTKAGQAIKAGVGVVRGTAGRLAKFNLPKSVDPKKIEVDINGDLTPESITYLKGQKIGNDILDRIQGDFRQDMFGLKIRQQNDAGTFMSKTDDFSGIPAMPKTDETITLSSGQKVSKTDPYKNSKPETIINDEKLFKILNDNPDKSVMEIAKSFYPDLAASSARKKFDDAFLRQTTIGKPTTRIESIPKEVANRIDFNLSLEENIKNILAALNGKNARNQAGTIGGKIKRTKANNFPGTPGEKGDDTGISGFKDIKTEIKNKFIEKFEPEVSWYKNEIKKIIRSYGSYNPPPEFYANLGRGQMVKNADGSINYFSYNVTRKELKNYNQAWNEVREEMGAKVFENKWEHAYHRVNFTTHHLSPEDAAQVLKKQRDRGSSRTNVDGPRLEKQAEDLMRLSPAEESRFDKVNEIWKTNTSTTVKKNKELQEALFNDREKMIDLAWSVDGNGNLNHAFLVNGKVDEELFEAFKNTFFRREFKDKSSNLFFQSDHIKEYSQVEKGQQGLNLLSNVQVIPARLNTEFKRESQKFIKKFLQMTPGSDEAIEASQKLNTIIAKAEDLGVTLSIGSADDVKRAKNLGASVNSQYVGYKRITFEDDARNQINKYFPTIELKPLTGGMAMGGTPISREKFQEGTQEIESFDQFGNVPGTIKYSIDQQVRNTQQDILNMYSMTLREPVDSAIKKIQLRREDVEKTLSEKLNPPQPVKFKFSELPKLVTQSPILQAATTDPRVAGLETIEFIYNSLRRGFENDIEMEEKFPKIYKMNELTKIKGPGPTPDNQDYISAVDEFNRAADTGLTNFAYNVGDLLFSLPDAVLPTEFTDELKRRYEDSDLAKPETFVGQIASVALEFGIPGGIAFKLINRFRKFAAASTGGRINLFTQKTYALEGLPKLGVQISNVAKRVGTTALSFGAGDFIAGGPYNTIAEMFDDPLLSSKLVGKYEDTSEMSGKERVAANFKNRLRFSAEGAMIGGVFPLVGPALGVIGKQALLKPALFLGGGALKIANTVAIKPATYLASKDPIVLPGLARGVGVFGEFLGKDVLGRLAATVATGGKALIPSLKGNLGQLPEFNKWRMFDVTSSDPLEAGLKKVDNFLKWFREAGNQTLYAFNLSGGAERFIKSKAREIEKYIDGIERRAYDLANGFLGRYNKGFTSPAGERHMLEQVYEYLRGNLKITKIEPELRELAKALKTEFDSIKGAYFKELPEGSGLRAALESNLDKYMRMSFATFTNPNYIPNQAVINDAVSFMTEIITKNEDFLEAAIKGVPVTEQAAAIRSFAQKNVDNIIAIGKREGVDPLNALNKINREILRGDDVLLQTGEELPQVIRNLLGQERNLRASVMSTTGSLVSQTANIKAFKEFARHGLENGYLFTSRAEALAAGITDPKQISNLPGLGQMQDLATADKDGPIGLFASNELKQTIENTGGMLDNLLQNSFYQSLIAYKAAVQTGKTVFSPATQTRNFGSAGYFPMHVGHIGGNASVTDAFKIIMDDIFGAGRTVNEVDLIKRISRKVELGVLDENIVASELGAILKDIKAGKLQSIGKLAERVENTKFYKQATRVYAGGDNVWKWYGHEYYMSQLKGAFKDINAVKRFFQDIHGIEYNVNNIMTGARKTLDEGIEEAAAFLLRETYPTYSKVPEFIKAIRKLPIGNFVSFTSEILRTGFATSSIAMKHIASDNQLLREMGYRMLSGQAITLGGMTAGVVGLGHALTNVTPTQIEVYKQYFAPDYMKYSSLIPISNVENGTFKVFDFSRYNPYDIIVASGKQLMKVADRRNYSRELAALKEEHDQLDPASDEARALRKKMKQVKIRMSFGQTLDPEKIQTDTLRQYLNYVGPLYDAVTGTFFGIPIGAEAFLEAATGKTRQGSPIWSKGMADTEIFDRAMGHFFRTIEPGIISSGRKLFHSLRGDVSGVGQPLEIDTEVFKLMGGSNVTVDVMGSLDFKISEFQQSFREPKVAKDWYSTVNFKQRGPEQLVREYREQNEQAFRAQYEFYKAAMAAIDSGLVTRNEVMKALAKRIAPTSKGIPTKVIMLMNGRYTPLTYGPEGLKSRREKILRNQPDLDQRIYNYQYFYPLGLLEAEKNRWKGITFKDMERREKEPEQTSAAPVASPTQTAAVQQPQIQPIPDTGNPVVQPQVTNVDQSTGLTTTETALLSPGEQAIVKRQRGIA